MAAITLPTMPEVHSSSGDFVIDEDGKVLQWKPWQGAEPSYANIVSFDLAEYQQVYSDLPGDYDILDLGCTYNDGTVETADPDFRVRVQEVLAERANLE
jgi:hypothetical protein